MIYSILGKTGLKVSRIGLGTAQLGGTSIMAKRVVGKKDISERQANAILEHAYTQGINFFDTSDRYGDGRAERALGKFFKKDRKKVYFATKCGFTKEGTRDFSKEYIFKRLDSSLERLQTDHVDIFQLTAPDIEIIKKGEIFKVFAALKQAGKIRFSGISVSSVKDSLAIINNHDIDTLQIRYNLLDVHAYEIIKKAHEKQIGIIIKSPLNSGVLSGTYTKETKFPTYDIRNDFLSKEKLEERLEKIEVILKNFSISNKDLLHFSLRFLLSDSHISTILVGNSDISQLQYNLAVLEKGLFGKNEMDGYLSVLRNI
jgi:aryl-alcohol dehydrogenase-like predicted oxidoreductase